VRAELDSAGFGGFGHRHHKLLTNFELLA